MKELNKLEECRSLMRRICSLPDNEEELKKKGFDEEDIETLKSIFLLLDPEANKKVQRMLEIIDYCDNLDSQKRKNDTNT